MPKPVRIGMGSRSRAILGCLLAAGPLLADGGAAGVPWTRSLKAALAESAASGRPVLVDVWANWCLPCRQMDETTYRDPDVVRVARDFVPLKVDHDVQELFVERHRIEALPLVLFLDADGREISRMAGRPSALELARMMTVVREGYDRYREARARPTNPSAAAALGSYLVEAGNPARAAEVLRRALKGLDSGNRDDREPLRLRLAEAQLAAGEFKPAAETFARLANDATDRERQGLALAGFVRAERGRGRAAAAAEALERLRREFPERAAELDAAP